MKFTVAAGPFVRAVDSVTAGVRAHHKKKLSSLLAAVRLEAVGGAVTVACSNNSTAISAVVPAEVTEPGHAAVSDRLAELSFATKATLTVSSTDRNLTVTCGNSVSRLAVLPWDDLPPVLALDWEEDSVAISGADCRRLLWPFSAAESENAARSYLSGGLLHGAEGGLVMVATDGAILMRILIPASGPFSEGRRDLVLPSLSARVLEKLLKQAKDNEEVVLRRSRTLLAVEAPTFSFVSPLLLTQFPNYEHVLPKASPNTANCDRSELLLSLGRLAAVSTAEAPLVALSWTNAAPLGLFLARQPEDGSDVIDAETCGGAGIVLPLAQLTDMLREFDTERLQFETSEGSPLVVRDNGRLALITRSTWNFRKEEAGAAAVA
jgi:DNA polymerase-3 subunit beta